jgi:hypothetical protein
MVLGLALMIYGTEKTQAASRPRKRASAPVARQYSGPKPSGIWGTAAWIDKADPHRWVAINPLGNYVVVVRRANDKRVVRRVLSDIEGRFQTVLPPGNYRIELELASDKWRLVTVRPGIYTRADIRLDQPLDMSY